MLTDYVNMEHMKNANAAPYIIQVENFIIIAL